MKPLKILKQNANWLFSGIGIVAGKWGYEYLRKESIPLTWLNIASIIIVFLIAYFIFSIIQFLRKKDFLGWMKAKAVELGKLLVLQQNLYVDAKLKYDCFGIHNEYFARLTSFKDYFCFTQSWLAQYSFMAGELHKEIKDCMRDEPDGPDKKKKLEKLCQKINNDLDSYQELIFKESCKYIQRHFHSRSKIKPRICLKAVEDSKSEVVAIFREKYEYFINYKAKDNKGFEDVHSTGQYFICNNIPQEVADKKYWNPRIDRDRVMQVYFKNYDKNNPKQNEKNWQHCWNKNEPYGSNGQDKKASLSSKESCYKSTMIIPLTLLNNEGLRDSFREHFNIPTALSDEDITARAIYGFLCFDHQEINFFNEKVDKRVGYVFADMLSIFMIHQLIFTKYSKTFNRAKDYIKA